ncbi:hypothetical protein V8G54_026602 [Vigna mungo]|uniref:Uncharacterized protein n=1 Tax=Vigna mungo TaxID=3915 RepID=A0AAQ3MZV7_VIGMU
MSIFLECFGSSSSTQVSDYVEGSSSELKSPSSEKPKRTPKSKGAPLVGVVGYQAHTVRDIVPWRADTINDIKRRVNGFNEQILNKAYEVFISIHDHTSSYAKDDFDFRINITVENGLRLANVSLDEPKQLLERKVPIAQGGVLKSSFFLYGGDTDRKGLVIILREKRCDEDEELPYMITVKHSFMASCNSHDVSVVAKIHSNGGDGDLNVEIEKPRKHPKGSC